MNEWRLHMIALLLRLFEYIDFLDKLIRSIKMINSELNTKHVSEHYCLLKIKITFTSRFYRGHIQ